MIKLIQVFVYKHLVHSMTLDPGDVIWENYFTSAEPNQIKSFELKSFHNYPSNILWEYHLGKEPIDVTISEEI